MTEMNFNFNPSSQFNTQMLEELIRKYNDNSLNTYNDQFDCQSESSDEYRYEDPNNDLNCKECGSIVIIEGSQGYQTRCKGCGLVGENPYFVPQFSRYHQNSFYIMSPEEKQKKLDAIYEELKQKCSQLLETLNIDQESATHLLENSMNRLKGLNKSNMTVLTKLFVSIVSELSSEMKLNISKKTIYHHFDIKIQNHAQYIKKAKQITMFSRELPIQNKLIVSTVLDTYDLYQLLFVRLSKYSSSANMTVINTICDFIGFSGKEPNLKNTTNSIVIEYAQIAGANVKLCDYQKWQELIQQGLPPALVEMRSRVFNIDFTQQPPYFSKIKKSSKNLMNTAINLKIKGIVSNKYYTLKLFSKGKVVIAGVTNSYEQSEISDVIFQLFRCIFKLTKIPYSAPLVVKTTLSNFSSYIPLKANYLIDIAQASLNLKNKADQIQELCTQNNTMMIGHKVINHRIYIDLAIEKKQMPFYICNTESTSNLKSHRSVQFILTQSGKLIIQGADDNLINTIHVRKVFGAIFDQYISPFVYNPESDQNNNQEVFDMDELTQILNSCKQKIQSEQQTQLITNIWTYFQKNHILAEHSIRVKIRYFTQILDIVRLISLNEQDIHLEQHDFNPLSYITTTEHPFKVPTKPLMKTNTLDICYKCIMQSRKHNKVQNPGLQHFLTQVIKVPELSQQLIQLLQTIINAITKTTKKSKNTIKSQH